MAAPPPMEPLEPETAPLEAAPQEAAAGGPPRRAPAPRPFITLSVCARSRGQVEQLPELLVRAGQRTVISVWAGSDPRASGQVRPAEALSAPSLAASKEDEKGALAAPVLACHAGGALRARLLRPGPTELFTEYLVEILRPGAYWVSWSLTAWGDVAPLLRAGISAVSGGPLRLACALPASYGEKGERLGAHYSGGDSGPLVLKAGQLLRLALDPVEFDSSTRPVAWRLALHALD